MTSIRKTKGRKVNDQRTATGTGPHTRNTGPTLTGFLDGKTPIPIPLGQKGIVDPATLFAGLYGKTDRFSNMLVQNAGSDSWAQFLASLGIWQGDNEYMSSGQRADWNKQILDTMLKYYQDVEERQYTKGVLDEQRQYDSPTNQLARLMGAGVSRDAAIAMLSGQGNAPTVATGVEAVPGTSPTESLNNEMQRKLGIANAVMQGVSSVTSLLSLGFTIPQAIAQTNLLSNQNLLTQSQLKSYQSTGKAFQVLKSIGAGANAFGSVGSAISAITKAAQDGNQDALSFIQSGAARDMMDNVSFASHAMADMYRSERSSTDYARTFSNQMRAIEADTDLKEANFDLIQEEILNAKAEFEEIWSRVWLNREQERSFFLTNEYEQSLQDSIEPISGETGLQLMTSKTLQGLVRDCKILGYTNNEEYWQAQANAMLSDAEKVAAINMLLEWRNSASLEMAKRCPGVFKMACALADCGLVEYADIISKGMKTESVSVSGGLSGKVGKFGGSLNGSYSESSVTIDPNIVNMINRIVGAANEDK